MHSDAQVTTLNTLITTLIDSVNGYEDAAANSENQRFQQIFREQAGERRKVVEDLRAEVSRLGGSPSDDGSFMGKTHQRWLDLKAAVTGRDEKAIVNSVELRRGLSQGEVRNRAQRRRHHRRLPGGDRARLPVGAQGPRPDEPAQARHGNARANGSLSEQTRAAA